MTQSRTHTKNLQKPIKYGTRRYILPTIGLCAVLALVGCKETTAPPQPAPDLAQKKTAAHLVLTRTSFDNLPGWGGDDFIGFETTFRRSCNKIKNKPAGASFGVLKQAGTYGAWQTICAKFKETKQWNAPNLQAFFQTYFHPYEVSDDGNTTGLFTGYYEASLKGSRVKFPPYTIPLHTRPDDLIMVQLGDFREELKGMRIAGRVVNGRLKPYENREKIVSGAWPHNDQVLLYVDNAVDAFFVQIQGSGLVQMNNGETLRIGYAGQNGHPYYAIGRYLIANGAIAKKNISMQSIRAWLEAHPTRAKDVMNTNKSYVFFREIKGNGPIGAQGVALTAKRSLAVDRTQISYGIPIWLDIEHPVTNLRPLRRMMVSQDTGGAIRGAVRADFFWGNGTYAQDMAGRMKSSGRYWVMLPK